MRLTNLDRDAFIDSVLDDVPATNYQELARTALQRWAIDHLPPKVRALHKDFAHLLRNVTIYNLPGRLTTVSVVGESGETVTEAMKADVVFWASIQQLAADAKAQVEVRDALRAKVKAVIYSCTTVEQAHERLPEFSKYLKSAASATDRSVPVVANLVADLNAAGWPKGKKKPATAKVV